MKHRLFLSLFSIFSLCSFAQQVSNGFYRVQNYGTQRYAYVYDSTGSINVEATSADMGAIVLHGNAAKRLTDPASVIYISYKGKNTSKNAELYDLEAQGTGVHKIINFYVTVAPTIVPNTYYVYESQYGQYLCDPVSSKKLEESYVDTKPQLTSIEQRYWSVLPIESNTDEYLGIQPSANMQIGTKYYKPYYFGFGLELVSSGMKAFYVSDVKEDAVIIKEVTGTIPAATPVIIECSTTDASRNRVMPLQTTVASIKDNRLSGNYFCFGKHTITDRQSYDPAVMRLLAVKDGRLMYITDTNHEYTTQLTIGSNVGHYIPANSSFLRVPAGSAASLPVMTQEEYDQLHPATKKGDINGDGLVNPTDVLVLYRYISSGKTASEVPVADINGDGLINPTDVLVLYRLIASGK